MKHTPVYSVVSFLAVLYTLYFASEILIPIVVAVVLSLAFAPVIDGAARHGIPRALSGVVIVAVLCSIVAVGLWQLSDSALQWLARSPTIINQIEFRLREIKEPVKQVKEASEKVQEMTEMHADRAESKDVVVKPQSFFDSLFGTMKVAAMQFVVSVVLLLLILSTGNLFKLKLLGVLPNARAKRRGLATWRKIERDLSTYICTVSLINLGFGGAVTAALHIAGMPNALLWGTMAALLNFMPYVGAVIGLTVVAMVAIITFDTIDRALLIPLIYAALNFVEAQFVTPVVLGNRLSLNVVAVFVGVIICGWAWGMPGAALAVPILIITKTVCQNSGSLRSLAEFMMGKA